MGLVRFHAPLAGEVGPRQVQTSEHGRIDWTIEDEMLDQKDWLNPHLIAVEVLGQIFVQNKQKL